LSKLFLNFRIALPIAGKAISPKKYCTTNKAYENGREGNPRAGKAAGLSSGRRLPWCSFTSFP